MKLHHLSFSISQCSRSNKKGGCVAIFSDMLSCKNISFGLYSIFEYLALIIKSVCPCLVLTVYHPPRLRGFLSEFGELLSKITVEYDSILIEPASYIVRSHVLPVGSPKVSDEGLD